MTICCCNSRQNCVGLAVVISAILGVIAAFLRITAVITVTPAFLWVVLGIAVVYLAVLLATTGNGHGATNCRCGSALTALLAGILGAALISVILLGVTFAATSIVGAILVGLLILSLSLIVSASACVVNRCCEQKCDG